MLDDEAIEREIVRSTRALVEWAVEVATGQVSVDLVAKVQHRRDVLVCLIDEAPARYGEDLNYLIDRCEALATRLAN